MRPWKVTVEQQESGLDSSLTSRDKGWILESQVPESLGAQLHQEAGEGICGRSGET